MNINKLTVNGKTYEVIKLLGKGKGGYSYLVERESKEYVLKQIHHEPCAYYTFGDKLGSELKDYNTLKDTSLLLPMLLEVDKEEERILKEYIEGDTIYDYVLYDRMEQRYISQIEEICKELYAKNINIDYFPTNFVVKEGKLYYIDYECNMYMQEWDFEHWGIKYWSKSKEFLDYVREHE